MDPKTKALADDSEVWKKTAADYEKTVINQPRGAEITYRVTAVNKNVSGPSVKREQVMQ